MNITDFFKDEAINALKGQVEKQIGTEAADDGIINDVIGMVMKQLGQNSEDPAQAKEIVSALDKHATQGINLDLSDGKKILSHIFGSSSDSIQSSLTSKASLDDTKSKDLLALASSFVMENLGNAKANGKIDETNISSLTNIAKNYFDKNNDGSVMDDMMGAAKKFFL